VRPYLEKNPSQNRAGGVAQYVGPEFKPQYHKKEVIFLSSFVVLCEGRAGDQT
jgi:hypothetical protein